MKYWSRFPVFRVLIPFSAGILTCINFSPSLKWMLLLTVISLVILILFTTRNYASGKYAQRWLAGFPFYVCFFGLGFLITHFNESHRFKSHYPITGQPCFYIIKLREPPVKTFKGFKLNGEVKSFKSGDSWNTCRGNLLLYLKDTNHTFQFTINDQLAIYATVIPVPKLQNPNGFDYAKYLEGKGLYFQTYISNNDYALAEQSKQFTIFSLAHRFRKILLDKIEFHFTEADQRGVAGALLLGYEEWLDPELESSYTGAGVLHVLCVSGMHVGLIYVILVWLLAPMQRFFLLRHLKFIILLLLIWFYAMVTGFAPSVIRASAMFSFVIAGKWLDKNSSIYNNLCSSCVMMFTFDPFLIASAGFQLSFLAVCGIVFFHPLIFKIYTAPNVVLHKTWELVSISIAAQLSTFPLSLYLFHQFPNYFLIGNLIIIPLSTLVMYSGLLLLVLDWLPVVNVVTCFFTANGIDVLNALVALIGAIPGAVTENVFVSFTETILLYLLLIIVPFWIVKKHFRFFVTACLLVIVLLGIRISLLVETAGNNQFTVYSGNGKSIYSLITSNAAMVFTDTTFTSTKAIDFILKGHLIRTFVRDTLSVPLRSATINSINKSGIVIIRDWNRNFVISDTLKRENVKYLVLGGNLQVDGKSVMNAFNPGMVIFDSSCKKWQVNKLQSEFKELKIPTYDVSKQGAFEQQLDVIR